VATVSPQFEVSGSEETRTQAQPTGNPVMISGDGKDAASTTEDVSNVSRSIKKS